MRINLPRKSMDIESRDIEYILPAYVRLYLFQTKNEDPEKIIFPMFRQIPHPSKKGVFIPIEYVPDDSPIAVEIEQDGSNIPKATDASVAEADKKEAEYDQMKKRIEELEAENKKLTASTEEEEDEEPTETPPAETTSPARQAFAKQESAIAGVSPNQPTPERLAKARQPENPAPPGSASDYGSRRDAADQKRIARDLKPEKDIKEDEERVDDELVKRVKSKKQEK